MYKRQGNTNGIAFTKALQTRDFEGLAFVNLVDFDMLYGCLLYTSSDSCSSDPGNKPNVGK